jgi:hypothetical protein
VKVSKRDNAKTMIKIKRFFINPPCVKNGIPYVTIISLLGGNFNVNFEKTRQDNAYSTLCTNYLKKDIDDAQYIYIKEKHKNFKEADSDVVSPFRVDT